MSEWEEMLQLDDWNGNGHPTFAATRWKQPILLRAGSFELNGLLASLACTTAPLPLNVCMRCHPAPLLLKV